ncbi:MAG TPA: metallophosphoesterase [Allosphingosinicella sp.]|jgi:3',5'-cyclic AMP phosphodiesterase CpdA
MATIAHLSDVHFGAHDQKIVDATEAWLLAHRPDLVIISGDFTQRARVEQFQMASVWLNKLRADGFRILAVPGNHDVPLYDVARRFARPLARYKRYISNDLCPWYEDDRLAVLGINTARSLTIKDGRINREQMEIIRERFKDVPEHKTRILVTHHPLYAMPIGEGGELSEAVGRHEDAVKAVCQAGVHIALAGHFHRTYAEAAGKMVRNSGRALVVQAGTTTSVRLRNNELQSFNWIETHRNNEIDLQVVVWDGERFKPRDTARYTYDGESWNARPVVAEPLASQALAAAAAPAA